MRTLEKNKVTLWVVSPTGSNNEIDEDGNMTGEKITTYNQPIEVKLSLYPAGGEITEQMFGKDTSIDMISVSSEVILTPDSLLFETLPTSDFRKTYTYRVNRISKSLNTYAYGFTRRT